PYHPSYSTAGPKAQHEEAISDSASSRACCRRRRASASRFLYQKNAQAAKPIPPTLETSMPTIMTAGDISACCPAGFPRSRPTSLLEGTIKSGVQQHEPNTATPRPSKMQRTRTAVAPAEEIEFATDAASTWSKHFPQYGTCQDRASVRITRFPE